MRRRLVRPIDRSVAVVLVALAIAGCARREKPPIPAAETFATAPDGVSIAYDVRGAGEPALVFIHGWCCNRSFWKNQVDAFATDHQVVTLDLPGHGASGSNRSAWSIRGLGADVQAVVEARGLSKVVLVGHSLGGPIALEAARLLPGRVVAVIAIDTLQDVDFVYPPEAVEQMAARFERDFTGTMTQAVRSMFTDAADPVLVEWVMTNSVGANHAAAAAIMRDYTNFDMKRALSDAKVPVRCLNAMPRDEEGGVPTNVERNRQFADFDAVMLEGGGHFPMLEQPQSFNEQLREVLKALPKS